MKQPPTATTITRLRPEVYEAFAKQFKVVRATEATTALQLAQSLGEQRVLEKLRETLVLSDETR